MHKQTEKTNLIILLNMTYNKKQMQPLIDKYGINPETNKLFIKVCEMFDGQSNYQIWAVRMIFSQSMTFEELETIHTWITTNSNMINKLEKQNVVSYSNKSGVAQLLKEIKGLERIAFVKNIISHFNTEQKKILTESILGKEYTPIEAYENANLKKWYDVFKTFNKKPMNIKNKFYSSSSALKNAASLHQAILDCLNKTYDWKEGKEDLLAYMEHNTKDCEVVFNEGPCVVVYVPSFQSSHKLCGNGRTGWCIAREESYFKSYVTSKSNRSQYFLFDFSRKESDAFAHIGFTVEGGTGIVEAQTCHNYSMINPYMQGNESLSIYNVFDKFGIKMSTFMRLPKELGFSWNITDIIARVKKCPESFAIAYEGDGRLIINVLNSRAFDDFVKKTFIRSNSFNAIDNNNKTYLFMDFNLPINNERSLIAMQYHKDMYGSLSLYRMYDIFGADISKEGYLSKIGISTDAYLNREAIDPSILLHKLIDENDEIGAIKLIEKERGKINVNYEFNQRIPIFSAITNKMFKLFDTIVNCDGFDSQIEDGFGETLLQSLIYLHGSDEVASSEEDEKILANMIKSILGSKSFNLAATDINHDCALNTACEYPNEVWIVKELVSNKNVDVNVVNDFDCGAVSNCIRNNNLEALKVLGQRPDLKIRKEDKSLAKEFGINLDEYIKPTDSIFGKYTTEKASAFAEEEELELELTRA